MFAVHRADLLQSRAFGFCRSGTKKVTAGDSRRERVCPFLDFRHVLHGGVFWTGTFLEDRDLNS
jgi:hypothetical protein